MGAHEQGYLNRNTLTFLGGGVGYVFIKMGLYAEGRGL